MGQNEIERYTGAILNDPRFQKLRSFEHHGPANTVYDHSLAVTRAAYRIACALHLSEEETASVVRAALLHDFFLYDWHEPGHPRLHGFTHPGAAARNAVRYFGISGLEEDIIRKHMWPLTVIPPLHRAALIVSLVDKVCTVAEVFGHSYRPLLTACRV